MTDTSDGSAAGALRMADALLHSLGGTVVSLRFPMAAASGQDVEQLGLSAATFEDVPLGPTVFRRVEAQSAKNGTTKYELLISAAGVNAQMTTLGLTSVAELFAAGLGMVVRDSLLCILGVTASEAWGQPYLYRVTVEGPQGDLL